MRPESNLHPQSTRSTVPLELGMPHLGRNGLAEVSLFKFIGHDRWKEIEAFGGIPSSHIRDAAGSRLYATFFFFQIDLPRATPLSSFGENQTLTFSTDLTHYSKIYLDGRYVCAEHPSFAIRASNVFIYQNGSPAKLSLAVPVNLDFSAMEELPAPPVTLELSRNAKRSGSFHTLQSGDVPLYEGERKFSYRIDPDRDLNGAGLIYFANFVCFLDAAERRILRGLEFPVHDELLDARSTYSRQIGYFGNARSTDILDIYMRSRAQVIAQPNGERSFDFSFDYRVQRAFDQKVIVVSSCRKVAPIPENSDAESWVQSWLDFLTARKSPGSIRHDGE